MYTTGFDLNCPEMNQQNQHAKTIWFDYWTTLKMSCDCMHLYGESQLYASVFLLLGIVSCGDGREKCMYLIHVLITDAGKSLKQGRKHVEWCATAQRPRGREVEGYLHVEKTAWTDYSWLNAHLDVPVVTIARTGGFPRESTLTWVFSMLRTRVMVSRVKRIWRGQYEVIEFKKRR